MVRGGHPHIIINNGTQFAHVELKEYCRETGIHLDLASVAHPQSSGQVEQSNGLILGEIKPHLGVPLRRAAGAWAEGLPYVLWSLRTTRNNNLQQINLFHIFLHGIRNISRFVN